MFLILAGNIILHTSYACLRKPLQRPCKIRTIVFLFFHMRILKLREVMPKITWLWSGLRRDLSSDILPPASSFWTTISGTKFSSVAQLWPTLRDPMDCSPPGLPVHQYLLEPAQTHVHWVSDAIQPSPPLSSPSPPAFDLSQHQCFSNESVLRIKGPNIVASASASVLQMNIQNWFYLGWTGWISLPSKGLKSLLQHHSSKASVLQCSVFFYSPTITTIHEHWKNHRFD